ncbi:hypothetical protein MUK42_09097 [Musa troglodytarum]|uniref:Uncharacterized protein n=1 Tax=Musa troglodytarum TaxID=320322 RepID=A0A9E7JAY6_9LILI|nr:hypothetical protein MUK42_09097 [Musa troglodytarum]
MGSVSLNIRDGTAHFRRATLCSTAVHLLMLASVLTTNLFALYAFTSTLLPPPLLSSATTLALAAVVATSPSYLITSHLSSARSRPRSAAST